MDKYVPFLKKKGATNERNQIKALERRFPKADGEMNEKETLEYEAFKSGCTPRQKEGLESTDTLFVQLCALQYMPKDLTPIYPTFPYGKVEHVNAKTRTKKKGGKMFEAMVHPPLTVAWVNYCFTKGM